MSCKALTIRRTKCKNNVYYDDMCKIHYKKDSKEKKKILDKKCAEEINETKMEIKQQYNDLCNELANIGLNKYLIQLIIEYRTDIFSDLSWKYLVFNETCMTFNSIGNIIFCQCNVCCENPNIYIKSHSNREKNYQLKHCVYCECHKCMCELAAKYVESNSPILAEEDQGDCNCWICKKFGGSAVLGY